LCEPAPHCIRWHEVDERLLAVDLDDREQFAVPSLELGVAVDQDLLELEAELVPSAETVSRARSQRWHPCAL
jgi:hypothetical protein